MNSIAKYLNIKNLKDYLNQSKITATSVVGFFALGAQCNRYVAQLDA